MYSPIDSVELSTNSNKPSTMDSSSLLVIDPSSSSTINNDDNELLLQDNNLLFVSSSSTFSTYIAMKWSLIIQVLKDNYKDPLFLGHVLNLIFMIFYVLLDFSRSWDTANPTTVSAGFIILGIGYIFDSILYLQSWGDEWPTGIALYGELLNILGSVIYACSAVMYLYEGEAPDADSVFIIEATATVIFLVDAIFYFMAWYAAEAIAPRKGCHYMDINLWGHLLNIAPAIIYVMSAINGLIIHFATRDSLIEDPLPPYINNTFIPSDTHSLYDLSSSALFFSNGWSIVSTLGEWKPERPASIVREMTKIYIWGDLLWTIDAAILLAGWCIDTCVPSEETEEEEEISDTINKKENLIENEELTNNLKTALLPTGTQK